MTLSPELVAGELLETMPSIMRAVREQMRRHRSGDLSVTQFRVLAYIDRHAGASLSAVSDHIGLTLPTMSKLVDGLVARKLVVREFDRADRRRMTLKLTGRGRDILEASRAATRAYLTEKLSAVGAAELKTILAALNLLRPLFMSEREARAAGPGGANGHS